MEFPQPQHRPNWLRRSMLAATAFSLLATAVVAPSPAGAETSPTMSGSAGLDCATTANYSPVGTTGSLANLNEFMRADLAHSAGYTGEGIDVAVIDTGTVPVDGLAGSKVIDGPDLSFDAPYNDLRFRDTYGHGTHMAGIIAGNNGSDIKGVAPGARIVNVKVGDNTGAVDVSQVIAAVDWVVAHRNDDGKNIRVINLSYRSTGTQDYRIDPLVRAVENAWDHGIVVVVAAGNDGVERELANPARDPLVIAVGALSDNTSQVDRTDNCVGETQDWQPASYSTTSGESLRQPDIYAPGTTVLSLRTPGGRVDVDFPNSAVTDRFMRGSGSSQAAAAISGSVAVLLEARPDLTPDEVKAVLMASARQDVPGSDAMVDVDAALRTPVPANATQTWERSVGTGTLDGARGTDIVTINGKSLIGENTFVGPFDNAAWQAALAADGNWWELLASNPLLASSWYDGWWSLDVTVNGSAITNLATTTLNTTSSVLKSTTSLLKGSLFSKKSWSGSSWSGSSWSGSSWSGSSWSGSSWSGSSWSGSSWSGSSWSGSSWSGSSWSGSSWSGSSWSGSSWS